MSPKNEVAGKKKIVVAGDITLDWNFAIGKSGSRYPLTNVSTYPGGAALLSELLKTTLTDLDCEVIAETIDIESIKCNCKEHLNSYLFFKSYKKDKENKESKEESWRISEFKGYNLDPFSKENRRAVSLDNLIKQATGTDILILIDANFNFRGCDIEPLIKACGPNGPKKIILKTASPFPDGEIWKTLSKYKDRLILIVSADDLRLGGIRRDVGKNNGMMISRSISWERTCHDVMWELTYNDEFRDLNELPHLFVFFPNDGVLCRTYNAKTLYNTKLIFDPHILEGQFEDKIDGKITGYGTVFTAAVASEIMSETPDYIKAAKNGLVGMRKLLEKGYASDEKVTSLKFPFKDISDILKAKADLSPFSDVDIIAQESIAPETGLNGAFSTILECRHSGKFIDIAKDIVNKGIDKAIKDVPIGTYRKLKTLDRGEIESYNSIRNLMIEYIKGDNKKPLSIAVFGPPGAGKSFGVTEIAKSLGEDIIKDITFNISQFTNIANLISAFHRIRDISLEGKIPLVFWDEFDSSLEGQNLFWLKFFLSVMQDGNFSEHETIHSIGRGIFVFAGATSYTFRKFITKSEKDKEDFISVKGPDFVSRLHGFLDVAGLDPRTLEDGDSDTKDNTYPIRRAIILESQLPKELWSSGELRIEQGVLNALLETKTYRNGVRSLTAILKMCILNNRTEFNRSALPTENQLNAHVDAKDFMNIVHRLEIKGDALEKLAEAVHEVYWKYKASLPKNKPILERKDPAEMKNEGLVPYSELPYSLQESNRELAKSIPSKLYQVGYIMMPAREGQGKFDLQKDVLEHMAKLEHIRFMEERLAAGWSYGLKKDAELKISPYLVPWDKLDDATKEYDRVLFMGIPEILSKLGYTVVK